MIAAMGAWGWGMRRVMMDYNHWATLGVLGEILPWEDNRVELADEKDQHGLPVAKVTFNLHDNDKKLIEYGKNKVMETYGLPEQNKSYRNHVSLTLSVVHVWAVIHRPRSWTSSAERMISRTCLFVMEASYRHRDRRTRGSPYRLLPRGPQTI